MTYTDPTAMKTTTETRGRPKLSNAQRKLLMEHLKADKLVIRDSRLVHVHTRRERGDGGKVPWWMFAGNLEDPEIQSILNPATMTQENCGNETATKES